MTMQIHEGQQSPTIRPQMSILDIVGQMDQLMTLGDTLVKSGMIPPSVRTKEAAVAIILKGQELGLGAMEAFGSINVIQGKPTISPQLMVALAERTGQLENWKVDRSDQQACCTVKRRNREPFSFCFTIEDADRMGLLNKTGSQYKRQPATMLMWRSISGAFRPTFADVLAGIYTPEEMGASVDEETGEVLEVHAEVVNTQTPDVPVASTEKPTDEQAPPPEPVPWIKTAEGQKFVPWLQGLRGRSEDGFMDVLKAHDMVSVDDIENTEQAKGVVSDLRDFEADLDQMAADVEKAQAEQEEEMRQTQGPEFAELDLPTDGTVDTDGMPD